MYKKFKETNNGLITYRFDTRFRGIRERKLITCKPSEVDRQYLEWIESLKFKSLPLYVSYQKYLDEKASRKSFAQYKVELKFFSILKEFFPDDRLNNFNRSDIDKFISRRLETMSRSSVNKDLNCLSSFFNWAITQELYHKVNPCFKQHLREDNHRFINLSSAQTWNIIDASKIYNIETPVMLALFAGLRRGEIITLQMVDIDFFSHRINISLADTSTKHHRRSVPMPDILYNHLRNIKELPYFSFTIIRKRWANLRSSLPFAHDLHFHDLRHVYAQMLRDAGISLEDIASFLGHTTSRTTETRYAQAGGYDGVNKVNKIKL